MTIRRNKRRGFAIVTALGLAVFLFLSPGVLADTGTFNASADSNLKSGSPNTNFGSNTIMDLTDTRDGVVRFDISSIPAGSTVTSATLTLVATAVGSATAVKNYGSHRILVDWVESTVTWNTPGSTAGTHYASSATETIAVSTTGSYNWNVTSDVASFVAGSATNYGWRVIWSSNTSGTNKQVDFGAKENATSGNRPVLSITYTPPDTTAPAAVSDLALSGASNSAMTVSWTAPGDDASTGTATSYDLRYSTSAITSGNFSSATAVTGEPTPAIAGSNESMSVTGLTAETAYYFAIKTADEVPNTSAISNLPSLATTATPDTTAPAAVSDLALSGAANSAMTVSWTAPGDDASTGTAASYDIRYSTSTITSGNWSSATQVSGEPTPQVAGTSQTMTATGLSAVTTYYFAIKTSDEVPNESGLSNIASATTTSSPSSDPSPAPSGGGSGGGTLIPRQVVFSGQAYTNSTVAVLRKSAADELYRQVPTESFSLSTDGAFSITHTGLLGSEYLFALRVKDKDGRDPGLLSFSVNLSDSFVVGDIFAPPTLGFETATVRKGTEVTMAGYASPNNKTEIEIDGKIIGEAKADAAGYYTFAASTLELAMGEHSARARQIDQSDPPRFGKKNQMSNFSITRPFKVSALAFPKADFNQDNKTNVSDWSIFLFRWGSKEEKLRLLIDMDGDGKIGLADFSIFLRAMTI